MEDTTTDETKPITNGNTLFEFSSTTDQDNLKPTKQTYPHTQNITLYDVFNTLVSAIVFAQPDTQYGSSTLLYRLKTSLSQNVPHLPEASRNSAQDLLTWTRRGSALRAILVVSVGTIVSLVLTGLLVFMLFFIAATVNAIVISLLVSLAAAGGFLAMFFTCVTAIYIGALSVAAFVISIATISSIVAVIITTGWIGFFWTVWLAIRGSVQLAKRSLDMTGSVLSTYTGTRYAPNENESTKKLD